MLQKWFEIFLTATCSTDIGLAFAIFRYKSIKLFDGKLIVDWRKVDTKVAWIDNLVFACYVSCIKRGALKGCLGKSIEQMAFHLHACFKINLINTLIN